MNYSKSETGLTAGFLTPNFTGRLQKISLVFRFALLHAKSLAMKYTQIS